MSTEITMPKLSDTMAEGVLVSWKKSVGDRVERGDIIAEVETDKANMELEAFASGILLEIRVNPGELVPVGTTIAVIGEAGEKVVEKTPSERKVKVAQAEAEVVVPEREEPEVEKVVAPAERSAVSRSAEGKASPLVRRLAREMGIDLSTIRGSGPEGRILREDLEKFHGRQESAVAVEATETGATKPPVSGAGGEIRPLSRMRAAIVRNVTASWQSIPHFSVSVDIDMGAAEMLHRSLKETGITLSLNDIIIKAVALVLEKFPQLNASFSPEGITLYPEINIGIAVSVEGGLLVPVIRKCDKLSLREISLRSHALADKARQGKISEEELSGGTFTVSNLGMFGIGEFSAVIYPSQAAILAVAAISDAPAVRDGRIVAARVMRVTLTADHRLVDGADAARFLSAIRKVLETPYLLLV